MGIHSTENLDDEYLGSGKHLLSAIKKYGAENFHRETIGFFYTRDAVVAAESKMVDEDLVNDPQSYNMVVGGGNPPRNILRGKDHPMFGLRG